MRELQTPEDFQSALKDILATREQLEELIEGMQDANALKQRSAQEGIDYFTVKLAEEKKATATRIEKFKKDVFDNYLSVQLSNKYDELGPYAPLFLERIKLDFLQQKEPLLANITLDNDIEKVIVERLERVTPAIAEEHRAAAKAYTDFNAYLQKIKDAIQEEQTKELVDNACYTEVLRLLEGKKACLLDTKKYANTQ